jgi:DNA-binding transcriptional regulator YdaS (Cro superfamily)
MNARELIEKAAARAGSQKALAARLNQPPPRVSEWKSKKAPPNAAEFLVLARAAGYDIPDDLMSAANDAVNTERINRECLLRPLAEA